MDQVLLAPMVAGADLGDLKIINHTFCKFHVIGPILIMPDHLMIIMHHGHHHSDVKHFTHLGLSQVSIICPSLVMIDPDHPSIPHSS